MSEWQLFAGFGLGAVSILFGVLVRAGYARRWAWQYGNRDLPFYIRNGFVGAIPLGLMFLFGAAAITAYGQDVGWFAVGNLLLALALASGLTGLLVTLHPPDWLKPRWLREQETAMSAPAAHGPKARRPPDLSPGAYWIGWLLLAVLLTISWLMSWPPSLFFGFAIASSLLAASRPRGGKVGGRSN